MVKMTQNFDGLLDGLGSKPAAPAPAKVSEAPEKFEQRPCRKDKKSIHMYVDAAIHKSIKQLALDEDRSVDSLAIEAWNMLLASRERPLIPVK